MGITVVFSATILLVVAYVGHADPPHHSAQKYTVDLDTKPEDRWTEIAIKHSQDIKTFISEAIHALEPTALEDIIGMITRMQLDLVNDLPFPYGAEILGITKAINLTTAEALLINLIYDMTAFGSGKDGRAKACTSIIAQTLDEIYHGRNLDYVAPATLQNMTITVEFLENGKVSYTGTTFVGYVGLLTGQKPHQFTVSLNQRDRGDWWMNVLEALITGTHGSATFLIRDVLANPLMDFKSAVTTLSSTPLIASSYIIVAGVRPNEGVVITRGRPRATDMWWLGTNHTWFLVETNYDRWGGMDIRRRTARDALSDIGQANLTSASVYKVLATPPVRNSNTVYSVVMSAAKPEMYDTIVWN